MLRSLKDRLGRSRRQLLKGGQLLSVSGAEVSGWVRDKTTPRPAMLLISVDGIRVSAKVVFKHSKKSADNGLYRFVARITSAQKCPEGSAVTVAYGDDRAQLAGSPWFVASAARKDFDYAFLHVPKTAGTSLRKALESALGAPQIFPSQAYLKARDGDYPPSKEFAQALFGLSDRVKLIQGHIPLYALKNYAPDAKLIAVFREPVARVISLIKHTAFSEGDASAPEDYILQKYLQGKRGAKNAQVRMLSANSPKAYKESLNSTSTERAISALQHIDILGITEQYDDFLARVSDTVGKPLRKKSLNRSRVPHREFSEHFISQVREANQLDIEFYEAVKSKLASSG